MRAQLVGYGTGLTAAYTALVLRQPAVLFGLLRLVPTALRDLVRPDSVRNETLGPDFPPELMSTNRRGMLRGPRAYLAGRRRASTGAVQQQVAAVDERGDGAAEQDHRPQRTR